MARELRLCRIEGCALREKCLRCRLSAEHQPDAGKLPSFSRDQFKPLRVEVAARNAKLSGGMTVPTQSCEVSCKGSGERVSVAVVHENWREVLNFTFAVVHVPSFPLDQWD